VPEGDTIFRAARTLNRALAGKAVTRFESAFPKLTRIHEDTPIIGRTVRSVVARGKWIEMEFSGGLVLVTHMLMNGSWHIYRPGESWRRPKRDMRVLIATEDFVAVAFNIQVVEFYATAAMDPESLSRKIRQDFLASDFNEEDALSRLRAADPQMQVGEALLRQSMVAGIGNVYKSEVAFACKVHPFAIMSSVADEQLRCMVQTARKFMQANVTDTSGEAIVTYTGFRRTTGRANPSDRLWVYGRAGKPCRRCGTPIRSRKQGVDARVTFWCPNCQKLPSKG
jgi:endonuclease VIII